MNIENLDQRRFTARDVREVVGVSYKTLSDWDSKGALATRRSKEAGWRRFRARDLFALMVQVEIRSRFGVPIERLRWIRSVMERRGADHLRHVMEMASNGFQMLLWTDLKGNFIVDADDEIALMVRRGVLPSRTTPDAAIVVSLNPLADRLLEVLGLPPAGDAAAQLKAVLDEAAAGHDKRAKGR